MKNTGSGLGTESKSKWHQAVETMSYRNIAGGLADEMRGFIRPSEPRKCSPPFTRRVRYFHFPATALLTDSSFVTRTFLIEHATPAS